MDRQLLTAKLTALLLTASVVATATTFAHAQGFDNRQAAIAPYEAMIPAAADAEDFAELTEEVSAVPATFDPWWSGAVTNQMRRTSNPIPANLESLIISALQNSAQIKVFSDLPLIRQTAITEADAAFDWEAFMETRWNDISEPVGNTLTTGGPPRFRDHDWTYSAGARRKNTYGGRFEAAQRFGHRNNNSVFFLPNNQGTSRLTLSYTQPLLRAAGRVYNTSLTVLAAIDAEIAQDEFVRQLQSHLLEVTRAYWGLHLERGALVQRRRVYERALETLKELEGRQRVDAVESQLVRVRAAVTERRAELVRAYTAVKNAQERIQALVNDPELAMIDGLELVPIDTPTRDMVPVDMQSSLSIALQQRPEIGQAVKQIKASCVRLNMAKNELLPQLDAVLETYVSGLQGNSDIGGAWVDQFSEGEPSYSVGLQYSIPIWRRAGNARLQRRRLEVRQLQNQFRSTVETLMLEVKVAVREVSTSYREASAKYESMLAAQKQLEFIQARWKHLPGEDRSVGLYLEDLLNAQERLAATEFGFLKAQTTYSLSLMNLKRAMGTLLQDEQIVHGVTCECCLPRNVLDKTPTAEIVPGQLDANPGQSAEPIYSMPPLPTTSQREQSGQLAPVVRTAGSRATR